MSDAVEDEGQPCNIQEGCLCFSVSGSLLSKKKKKAFNNESYIKEMTEKKERQGIKIIKFIIKCYPQPLDLREHSSHFSG